MIKKVLYALLLVIVLGVSYGLYLFYEKPPDIREEKEAYEISAENLVNEFLADETAAAKKYVDQVIVVSGKIAEIKSTGQETSVMLATSDPLSGITCSFYADERLSLKIFSPGMQISIKGKCTGRLMDVVLNHCSVAK